MDTRYRIGSLEFDPEINRVTIGDITHQVEPKLSAVLNYLYIHRGQVVKREQLIDAVWNSQVVSDNAVSRSISQVRKLLSQSNSPQPSIETIPRIGYRLLIDGSSNLSELDTIEKIGDNAERKLIGDEKSLKISRKKLTSKYFDWNSLKVILFVVFSLGLFARYFYELFDDERTLIQFSQSSLTLEPGIEKLPKFSPNGRWVAYVAKNSERTGESLFLTNLRTKQVIQLTNTPVYFLDMAWHPDSQSILFSTWNSNHDRQCEISLVEISSGSDSASSVLTKENKVLDCSERAAVKLAWHSNGNKIYLTSRPSYDRPYFIQSYALDSKRKEQITMPPQSGNLRGDYYLSGSLNGQKIAIVRYLGTQQSQLQVYETSNNKLVVTQSLDSNITALTWLGDDRLLISKDNNLFSYDYQTGQQEFYYSIGKNSGGLSSNMKGDQLVFTLSESDVNLVEYRLNSDATEIKEVGTLTESSAIEAVPAFSRAGDRYAFLSNRTGRYQIWVSESRNTAKQLSDSPVSLTLSPLSWSVDDGSILFQHDDEIFTIEVATGNISRIINREHKVANADWSYDGNSIFYSSEKSGEWQIWQYDMIKSTHRQITSNGGYSAKQDQAKNLYVSRIHQDGLWKLAYDTDSEGYLSPKLILDDYSGTNWLSWQLSDHQLYYFGFQINNLTEQKAFGIMKLDLDSLSTALWFSFKQSHQRYFSVSSQALIITKVTRSEGSIQLLSVKD